MQLTLVIQLSSVFLPALQPHPLSKQIKELLKRRSRALVVVHVLLGALTGAAVHHADLPLKVQLHKKRAVQTFQH